MMGGGPGGWGMGPGMMDGGPGGGMGPGMMGGAWGMGPDMMGGGWGAGGPGGHGWGLAGLDLSAEQRTRIGEIQADVARRRWELMSALHAQGGPMSGGRGDAADEGEARRAYEAMAAVHKQMFELHLEARRRVLELLTPAQREQLGRAGPRR
jgi:Spy/CpxP family protein refolding chaperone